MPFPNCLICEQARAILFLDPKAGAVPQIPNPFSTFLEKEPKSKLEALEMKRNRIEHMIEILPGKLRTVDKILT